MGSPTNPSSPIEGSRKSGVGTPLLLPDDMVFGFTEPHRPGTICGADCDQCGQRMEIKGVNGIPLPMVSFYIVAEATVEDWRRDVLKNGAINPTPQPGRHYYFVRTD